MNMRLTPIWTCCLALPWMLGALLAAYPADAETGAVDITPAAADEPQTQPTTQASPARPAPTPPPQPGPEAVLLSTHSAQGLIPVRSWKTLRDARIVKQDLDYSCGAA